MSNEQMIYISQTLAATSFYFGIAGGFVAMFAAWLLKVLINKIMKRGK